MEFEKTTTGRMRGRRKKVPSEFCLGTFYNEVDWVRRRGEEVGDLVTDKRVDLSLLQETFVHYRV